MSTEIEEIREEIMELVHRWSGDDQLSVFADPVDRLIAKLAAAQATIRDLENKLAAARRHCPDHDHRGPATAHNCGHCLAEARATIQQQARELEEADEALVILDSFSDNVLTREQRKIVDQQYSAAVARHSARAISEAKEEE